MIGSIHLLKYEHENEIPQYFSTGVHLPHSHSRCFVMHNTIDCVVSRALTVLRNFSYTDTEKAVLFSGTLQRAGTHHSSSHDSDPSQRRQKYRQIFLPI